MEQSSLAIWVDLVERVAYTAALDEQLYFYALPQSTFIIHCQTNNLPCYNLTMISSGKVVREADPESCIQIIVSQSREVSKVTAAGGSAIALKRSCDVNDLFKSYVCLYTNLRNPDPQTSQYYLILNDLQGGQQYLKLQDNKVSEVEEQVNKKQQKKATKQEPFAKLQSLLKGYRNNYKDQMDQLGKLAVIRHPILISVGVCYPQIHNVKRPGLGFGEGGIGDDQIVEWVSYHKYDDSPSGLVESHLAQIPQGAQKLRYSSQMAVPLTMMDDPLLLKQRVIPRLGETKFDEAIRQVDGKLLNVHQYLPPSKTMEGSRRYVVRGDYVFYHYLQDGFDDNGWGCAYRSFMSVLSWLMENGHAKRQKVPTHREIQQLLVSMDDKPLNFIGSQEWIGAFEVSMLIQKLTKVESKILHISNGPDIVDKLHEFRQHFLTQGSPIMFGRNQSITSGGGVYAYTLLGIDFNDEKQCKFLILDPHYVASDTMKAVMEKGGVGWKSVDMFLPGTFYNFCMPQVH